MPLSHEQSPEMHLPEASHDSFSSIGHVTTRLPHRILIIGGAYGGLRTDIG